MAVIDPKGLLQGVSASTQDAFLALADDLEDELQLDLQVRSGSRTCADQNELYGIGRTYNVGSPVVTYARGCRSWHVLGRAVDADPVDRNGRLHDDCGTYSIAGQLWENRGGVWGGRFKGFGECGDAGHFEWHPNLSITQACPDPDDCENARNMSMQEKPSISTAKLVAGSLIVLGLASAAYVLLR